MRTVRSRRGLVGWVKVSFWSLVLACGVLTFQVLDPQRLSGLRISDWSLGALWRGSIAALTWRTGEKPAGSQTSSLMPVLGYVRAAGATGTDASREAPSGALIAPPMPGPDHARPKVAQTASPPPGRPARNADAPPGSSALYPRSPHVRQPPVPPTGRGEGTRRISPPPRGEIAASNWFGGPSSAVRTTKTGESGKPTTSERRQLHAGDGQPSGADAAARQVSPAEAQAFAKAILSEPNATKGDQDVNAGVASPQHNGEGAVASPAPVLAPRLMTPQDARILADYAARRRAAMEAMRQWWEGPPPMPPPPMPPYGAYPYPPAYSYPPLP
jgi:hypothetical protein